MGRNLSKALAAFVVVSLLGGCSRGLTGSAPLASPTEAAPTATLPAATPAQPTETPAVDMASIDLDQITIPEIQKLVQNGQLTYTDLTQLYLDRIAKYDQVGVKLNTIIALNPGALEAARQADLAVQQNPALAQGMFGIPVLVKDNINFDQLPTTAGAVALANNIPPYNATVIDSVLDAGGIILGKANMSEFAGMMDDIVMSGVGGTTRHPYRPQVLIGDEIWGASPGGSSNGSAVSAAAALAPVTIGTETKGSLLGPAATNQVATLKPTTGLISRWGIIPVQFSQDTPGPMGRNITDVAVLLNAMTAGVDAHDSRTTALADAGVIGTDYTQSLRLDGLAGKRIGVLNLEPYFALPAGERANLDQVMAVLEAAGATIVKGPDGGYLPDPESPGFQEYIPFEFKRGLNEYLATLDPAFPIKTLTDIVEFNIANPEAIAGNGQSALIDADKIDVVAEAPRCDALIAEFQRSLGPEGIDALLAEYDLDALMATGSSDFGAIAGYPSVSVPVYFDSTNVQSSNNVIFTGTKFSEALLLEIAYVVEQGTHFRVAPGLADKTELGEAFTQLIAQEQPLIEAAMNSEDYVSEGDALKIVIANNAALNVLAPYLATYFDGLATQSEVEDANQAVRDFLDSTRH